MKKGIVVSVPNRNARVVAVEPAKNYKVIAHGQSTTDVLARASKAGAAHPFLMFVPKQGQRYIY